LLEDSEVTRFPKPLFGKIPNFKGSEKAAEIADLSEFKRVKIIKVNLTHQK